MIALIAQMIYKFILGGLRSMRGDDMGDITSDQVEKLLANLEAMAGDIAGGHDPSRTISPFEFHLNQYFNKTSTKSNSDIVENLLCSLVSLGEEISEAVPNSVISTAVDRGKKQGIDIIYGHLDWKVDNQSPLVYSICMDLLKDGFIFRADTKTFVISTEVLK